MQRRSNARISMGRSTSSSKQQASDGIGKGYAMDNLCSVVIRLAELVGYQAGAVVSREIMKGSAGTVSVFAFDVGEGLSEHTAPFDAMVTVLEGEAEIVISGKPFAVGEGETIVMPAGQPHSLKAVDRFKMLLTLIRS